MLEKLQSFERSAIPKNMKSLSENHVDITNMRYNGIQLVQGWLVTGQERVNEDDPPHDVWKAREIEDCEQDLRCLATDLLASIKIRINEVSERQRLIVCMDFDSIVKLVVGERNQNGLVKINEGALESFGTEEFRLFYHHVCSQRHIRELAELKDLMLDPSLSLCSPLCFKECSEGSLLELKKPLLIDEMHPCSV